MKKEIKYASIQTIKYTFDAADIKRALLGTFKITPDYNKAVKKEFELYEDSNMAELILHFETEKETK